MTSDKVIQDCDGDPLSEIYKRIEETNHNACDLLTSRGFNGGNMKVRLNMKKAFMAKLVTLCATHKGATGGVDKS